VLLQRYLSATVLLALCSPSWCLKLSVSSIQRRQLLANGGQAALLLGAGSQSVPVASAAAATAVKDPPSAKLSPSSPQPSPQSPPQPPEWVAAVARDPRLDFKVYAVVVPSGAPLAAIDLDGAGRVRTGVFFYTSQAEAEAGRAAATATSPAAANCVVTAVPFTDALALVFTPPYKISGLPGYFCYRFFTGPTATEAAKKLSSLDTLSDLGLPVFYAEELEDDVVASGADETGSGGSSKSSEGNSSSQRDSAKATKKTSDLYVSYDDAVRAATQMGARGQVAVADLNRVARAWATETAAPAYAPSLTNLRRVAASSPRIILPDQATKGRGAIRSGKAPAFKSTDRVLAIEWNVFE